MQEYRKYYFLSGRYTHTTLIDFLKQYYPVLYTTTSDYNRGFQCHFENGIHFELNKYDKDSCSPSVGQERNKIPNFSKNGYILTLPIDNHTKTIVHKLGGTLCSPPPPAAAREMKI